MNGTTESSSSAAASPESPARSGLPAGRRPTSRCSTGTATTSSSPSLPGGDRRAHAARHRVRARRHLCRARQRRRAQGRGGRRSTPSRVGRRSTTATSFRLTWSCSRPGLNRTSSTRQARTSSRSRSTRSTTPSGCAHESCSCSTTRAQTRDLDRPGALNFVVVGAGATGVETAGALAELAHDVMPHMYDNVAVGGARVDPRRPRSRRARAVLRRPRTPTRRSSFSDAASS